MNKKILAKTLLPIASVALIGGGIASSLVLTSCSKKDSVLKFKDIEEVHSYLIKHQRNLSHTFTPIQENLYYSDEPLYSSDKINLESRICEIYFSNLTSFGTNNWSMEFGHIGNTLILNYTQSSNYLEISYSGREGIQNWVLYNGGAATNSFHANGKFYFEKTPTGYLTLSFADDYSMVFNKTNTENANAVITASFMGGEDIEYYDVAEHDIALSWLNSKQAVINLLLYYFLTQVDSIIVPFDILVSETKFGHAYTFDLSAYYYYYGDTLSGIQADIEYVPDVSIAYNFLGGKSIDAPVISFRQFIKPTFSTFFSGSGYRVEANASRCFNHIYHETVVWEGRSLNFYYLNFSDNIDNSMNLNAFAI